MCGSRKVYVWFSQNLCVVLAKLLVFSKFLVLQIMLVLEPAKLVTILSQFNLQLGDSYIHSLENGRCIHFAIRLEPHCYLTPERQAISLYKFGSIIVFNFS